MKGIARQDVTYAGILALIVHFVTALALLPVSPVPLSPHLAVFFTADIALMAVNLIAPVAVWRGHLRWHDPLVWLFLMMLAMSCSALVSVLINPTFAQEYLGWSSGVFDRISQNGFLLRLTEAEAVMLCFNMVVLYVNRSGLKGTYEIQAEPQVALSMLPVCFLFVAGGVFGFMTIWRLGEFSETFTTTMGFLDESLVTGGNGRYVLLQSLGTTALPLFLGCAFVVLSGRSATGKRLLTIIVAVLTLGAALPSLINGSRLFALAGIVSTYMQLRHFGVKVGRGVIVLCICFAIGMVLFLTATRKNGLAEGSFSSSLRNFGDTATSQLVNRGNEGLSFSFDLDRVGTIAMVIEFTRGGKEYLFGESLVSAAFGLIQQFSWITTKTIPEWTLGPETCTEHLSSWRKVWAYGTPPSYAGDLFMQAGWIGLFPLSLLFGVIFRSVRTRLFRAKTMLTRFAWCYIGFWIAFFPTGEIVLIFYQLVFYLVPVFMLCWISQFALRGFSRAGAVTRGRAWAPRDFPKPKVPS
jgi:hypothetical protein